MEYILKSKQYIEDCNVVIKAKHEDEEKFITLYIQQGFETDLVDFKSLGIDLDVKELHSLIGTLLHIQQKMRGGKNG